MKTSQCPHTSKHKLPPKPSIVKMLLKIPKNNADSFLNLSHFGNILKIPLSKRYLINDPESIQRILQINFENYTKAGTDYQRLVTTLGEGLLTNSGPEWEGARKLIQPMFYQKNIIKYAEQITSITTTMLQKWEAYASKRKSIDISQEMVELALNVSVMCFFGADISGYTQEFAQLIMTSNIYASKGLAWKWLPTPRNLRFRKENRQLNQLMQKILAICEHNPVIPEPMLAGLFGKDEHDRPHFTNKQRLAEAKTLVVAGHDTTGNALAWAFYCLSQNSSVLAKLQNEITNVLNGRTPTMEDLDSLEYTEMVLDEAMRLYPPIWIFERKSLKQDELSDYRLPAGSRVLICPYTMHRHPQFWPDAEKFMPERFNREQSKDRHKLAYLPFGQGPRICIGKQFAILSAKLILAMIVQHFNFKLTNKVKIEPLITLKPEAGIWMRLTKR